MYAIRSYYAHFLNRIIDQNETPFIYEKIGTRFLNFMIDEFQDTSKLQWLNFRPLVDNSLANNEKSLIVGDVKHVITSYSIHYTKLYDCQGKTSNFECDLFQELIGFIGELRITSYNVCYTKLLRSALSRSSTRARPAPSSGTGAG